MQLSNRVCRFFGAAVCCVVTFSLSVAHAESRTWTSFDGKFTIEAEFLEQTDTAVKLKRPNGQEIVVPLAKLSKADQKFLTELNQPKEADPAEKPEMVGDEELAAAKKLLEEKGVSILSSELRLAAEVEFAKGVKDLTQARVKLVKATKKLQLMEGQAEAARQQITNLTSLNVQLNARLAALPPNNVSDYNRLVGAINANDGKISLIHTGLEKLKEAVDTERGTYNETREQYVQQVLDLRVLANSINSQYTKLATDADVRKALGTVNADSETEYQLAVGRSYLANDRKLKTIEDTVLQEAIDLRREGSDTYWVSVVLNGQHTNDMVIDSGASLISLPFEFAKKCGIEADSQAKTITLILADGSEIEAKEVMVDSVRVGKFTVENVRCAILSPKAVAAEPLLGMSFLREFRFEIDTQRKKLTMVKVDEDGGD